MSSTHILSPEPATLNPKLTNKRPLKPYPYSSVLLRFFAHLPKVTSKFTAAAAAAANTVENSISMHVHGAKPSKKSEAACAGVWGLDGSSLRTSRNDRDLYSAIRVRLTTSSQKRAASCQGFQHAESCPSVLPGTDRGQRRFLRRLERRAS